MRNSGKGFLAGLGLLLTMLPMMAAFAATKVTGIDHSSTADGGVMITLQTSGDVPQVSVFVTQSPARIVLDLADTESEAGTDAVTVGLGPVQQYSAIAAGGRTRLIVDLSQQVTYDYNADSDQVVLTIAGSGVTNYSNASIGGSYFSVTGVDFHRGDEGQARVIVSMDRPGASISVEEGTNSLTLNIFNASVPDRLNQRLDVIDFATPVRLIDTAPVNSTVQVVMTTSGIYEYLAYESGDDIVVEVKPVSKTAQLLEDIEVKFYEDKIYEGTKVTFNFQDIPVRSVLQLIADVSNLNIVVADNVNGSW